MANKKITELDAVTTLASTDVVPVVDVSADTTNKITAANLFRTLPDGTAAAPALAFSSDAANGVYLAGTDTVGISTGGTQRVTVDGSGNVTISGDLTVSGATTTVESTTVTIDDKNIELGSVASPSNTTADGGGITLKGATDKEIKWVNSTGYWTFNTGIDVGGNIELADSSRIKIGTGDDLQIYHDGTHSYINEGGTGNLKVLTSSMVVKNPADNETMLQVTQNGSVAVYYDNSKKLETKSDGIDVTGEVQCDSLDVDGAADITGNVTLHANLDLQDSDKILLGTGDDLEIYHDGSNSYIDDTGTGNLYIRAADALQLQKYTGENFVKCVADGTVQLYYNNSSKLTTKSDGIDVTGEVQCDSLDVDGVARISNNVGIGTDSVTTQGKLYVVADSGNSNDVKIGLSPTNSSGGTNPLAQVAATANGTYGSDMYFTTRTTGGTTAERVRIDSSGRLLIGTSSARTNYENSNTYGPILNLEGTSNSNRVLSFIHNDNSGGPFLALGSTGGSAAGSNTLVAAQSTLGFLSFQGADGTDLVAAARIKAQVDGTPGANDMPGRLIFETTADSASSPTERMRIDSSGKVAIGSTSPEFKLMVADAGYSGVEIKSDRTTASDNIGGLHFKTVSTNVAYIQSLVDGTLKFRNTSSLTERMRIDSSGRLLLGTTTEGNADADDFTVANSGACGITIRSGTSSSGNIYFSDATSGTGEYDGYIQYQQSNRALRFATAATERFRITSTGAWAIEGASNYGTSGQVLTSNGNDSPTWQDAGAAVVGGASAISMNDNVKIKFGAGDDLQIYHNGANSFIDNATGDLYIRGVGDDLFLRATDDIYIQPQGSENGISVLGNGAVELYFNNSKKFETKSDGVDITGELQCDSLDVDGYANFNGSDVDFNGSSYQAFWDYSQSSFRFQDNARAKFGTGEDLQIYHDGSKSIITDSGTGHLEVNTNNFRLQNAAANETILYATENGAVDLYYDNARKLQTKSDGVDITGELQCDTGGIGSSLQQANVFSIKGSTNNQVNICDSANSNWGLLLTQSQGTTNTGQYHYSTNSSVNKPCALVNVNNDSLHFGTNNEARFRINHDGHVLPTSNNSYDLGSSSLRWRNVYTNDLNLSNEGGTNDVDGTWGNYTIQEGEDDLFLINRRNGKKYKFNLTEVS